MTATPEHVISGSRTIREASAASTSRLAPLREQRTPPSRERVAVAEHERCCGEQRRTAVQLAPKGTSGSFWQLEVTHVRRTKNPCSQAPRLAMQQAAVLRVRHVSAQSREALVAVAAHVLLAPRAP